jgi:AcrR family transcriptional regulator
MTASPQPAGPAAPRPLRADAVRTRRALLAAAHQAFAEQGTAASVADIAQRAGIGKGTVFRHFATKDDLVGAIVAGMIEDLVAAAGDVEDENDPWAALTRFMEAGVELHVRNRSFCDVAASGDSLGQPGVHEALTRLYATADTLAQRARRQGTVREDLTGRDVMHLVSGVHHAAAPLLGTEPDTWRRYLSYVLDGIRPRTPERPATAPGEGAGR